MKLKTLIGGIIIISILGFFANYVTGQDEPDGTYLDESGEKQDSLKNADIFDFGSEFDEGKSSGTVLIIGIGAVVLVGGGIFYFTKKKKTRKVQTN